MCSEPLLSLPPLLQDLSPSLSLAFGLSHTCRFCTEFCSWEQRPKALSLLVN